MRPLLLLATGLIVSAGCGNSGPTVENRTSATTTTVAADTTQVPADATQFAVEAIGLTFVLPISFEEAAEPELLFLAHSMTPRAVVSIDEDVPKVINHPARPGETLTEIDLNGVSAVVVTDAAIEGLPAGISANELLVSNGQWSFTVIMSGVSEALPELWDVFLRSVVVQPYG